MLLPLYNKLSWSDLQLSMKYFRNLCFNSLLNASLFVNHLVLESMSFHCAKAWYTGPFMYVASLGIVCLMIGACVALVPVLRFISNFPLYTSLWHSVSWRYILLKSTGIMLASKYKFFTLTSLGSRKCFQRALKGS